MNLYGQEMDEGVSPLAASMGWTIAREPADRSFIGRETLELRREKGTEQLVGLVMTEKASCGGLPVRFTDSDGNQKKALSPAAPSRRRWATASRWLACRPGLATPRWCKSVTVKMPVKVTKPGFCTQWQSHCVISLFGDELMSNVPAELKYSKEHEWLRKEADWYLYRWDHRARAGGCLAVWFSLTCRKWVPPLKRAPIARGCRIREGGLRYLRAD